MTFALPFNSPFSFSSQSGVGSEGRHWLPVSIGTHSYMIEVSDYRRITVDAQRQQIDQQAEPSEGLLSSVGAWRRSQSSWRGGAGQLEYDVSQQENDREMFFSSEGMDVLGDKGASLLPDTLAHYQYPGTLGDGSIFGIYAGSKYFVAEDYSITLSAAVPAEISIKQIVGPASSTASVLSMATDGSYVYAVRDGEGIGRINVDGSPAETYGWSATNVDAVAVANGRLLAMVGPRIAEVSATGVVGGAGQLDFTDPRSTFRWLQPVSTTAGIVVGGGQGHVWSLYLIDLADDGSLNPPRLIAPLPAGETLTALYSYVNFIAIGTSRGVRVGQMNGPTLLYGSAVETEMPVLCFAGYGEYVYFGQSSDTAAGVGKIDLARATSDGRFAWQNDLRAAGVPGVVTSIVIEPAEGSVNFTIPGEGLYQQITDKVAVGTLTSSWITFGTSELKISRHIDLRHLALTGQVQVSIEALAGAANVEDVGLSNIQGSFGSIGPWRTTAEKFHRARYILQVYRDADDDTLGPEITLLSFSALPTPPRVERFTVPILLYSKVVNHQGDGTEYSMNTLEEFQYLKNLERSKQLISYREGLISEQVYIDGIEMQPVRWNDDTSFFEGICVVQLYSTTA